MRYNEVMVDSSSKRGLTYTKSYDVANQLTQGARGAVARKQAEYGQKISDTKNMVLNAPGNIKKAALNKQSAAQASVGAKAIRGRFASTGSQKTPSNWKELKSEANNMAVRGGPVLFWLVAGIAVIKDIIDVFSVLIDALGLAAEATVIGLPVGVGLQVLSEMIDKLSGLFIDVTVVAYFGYIGGGFALRLVIMSIGYIIDAVPGLDVLPLTTVSFFAAYLLGRVVKKATQIAESSVGKAVGKTGAVLGGAGRMGGRFVRAISR